MEHIEEAGIHSGDSACSLPAHSLASSIIVRLEKQTRDLALALNVVGLMNVQYAVKGREIYILEVNPRASRTVPFVAKVIGKPIAGIAARVMNGEPLAAFKLKSEKLAHVAVKEAVFPFARFPGVDTILGPEMRSTGEVMGIDRDYAMAFAKSQLGAGNMLPLEGAVFVSVRDADKEGILGAMRDLSDLGFRILATRGTKRALAAHGIPCEQVNKVLEGRPHIVDLMKNGEAQLVFNTTDGAKALADSKDIRRTALLNHIPVLYNFGWCAGGDSGHQGARGRHPYGGAAAVLCRARHPEDVSGRPPETGLAKPKRLSETGRLVPAFRPGRPGECEPRPWKKCR